MLFCLVSQLERKGGKDINDTSSFDKIVRILGRKFVILFEVAKEVLSNLLPGTKVGLKDRSSKNYRLNI